MKKILFLFAIFQVIYLYGYIDVLKIEKPSVANADIYEFVVIIYDHDKSERKQIMVKKFSFEDETTKRILKQIADNRTFINERFKKVYEQIEQSNKDGYLRPYQLVHLIQRAIEPKKFKVHSIRKEGRPLFIEVCEDKPKDLTPEQISMIKKENMIARLGLLDIAINHFGKNIKDVDKDIYYAIKETWIYDGDNKEQDRLKEDNLTIEWVFSLFARKEAFEATGWKPMYDDGTESKEPVKKEEPEMDSEEITISF